MSADAISSSHPIQSGEFLAQTLGSFDNSSLGALAVVHSSGFDAAKARTLRPSDHLPCSTDFTSSATALCASAYAWAL
jgi:hypothetical protein